ncbi:MAG: hypothetical protein MI923_12190 [Phycisphaerales bacterium]|nr:hypothetical protein [Phycisphaerales bacterium]
MKLYLGERAGVRKLAGGFWHDVFEADSDCPPGARTEIRSVSFEAGSSFVVAMRIQVIRIAIGMSFEAQARRFG